MSGVERPERLGKAVVMAENSPPSAGDILPGAIVRLRRDSALGPRCPSFVGLVEEIDGGRAVLVWGPPGNEVKVLVPLYDLEAVPWEELGEVPMVLVA